MTDPLRDIDDVLGHLRTCSQAAPHVIQAAHRIRTTILARPEEGVEREADAPYVLEGSLGYLQSKYHPNVGTPPDSPSAAERAEGGQEVHVLPPLSPRFRWQVEDGRLVAFNPETGEGRPWGVPLATPDAWICKAVVHRPGGSYFCNEPNVVDEEYVNRCMECGAIANKESVWLYRGGSND